MNRSKIKGTRFETDTLTYIKGWAHLAGNRWAAWRNPPAGTKDVGDLHLQTRKLDVVVECKAEKSIDLAGYMKELADEVANWETREGRPGHGVCLVKRRNRNVEEAYAVMPLGKFLQLLEELEGTP